MIYQRLAELQRRGTPFQIGIIGAGTFGTQIIAQVCRMQGMRIAAVAEIVPEKAIAAFKAGGVAPACVKSASSEREIDAAIQAGQPAVTGSVEALLGSRIDIVIEATGNPNLGARHGSAAIEHRKHVVMVTVEADVVVGHLLRQRAVAAGVVYSLAYGDEPALAAELCDWGRTLGFRVIAAGKGTRFIPAFRKANPDDVPRLYGFSGKDYNAQVFCSFLDGTKHSIEMAALANATGLSVDVRGMHFPAVDLRELPNVLCHTRHGGILQSEGVVEAVSAMRADETYVERNVRGGVFAVLEAPDNQAAESLATYGDIIGMMIGKRSRHVLIYRPQHFVGHEVAIGVARLLLFGEAVAAPIEHTCEVIAAAKKRLAPGTILDGEGGYCVYGMLEKAEIAADQNLVPIGLTGCAKVVSEIPEDGLITFDNVEVLDSPAFRMRRFAGMN
jgi:predicted homoserine dehydrogenase-like protein